MKLEDPWAHLSSTLLFNVPSIFAHLCFLKTTILFGFVLDYDFLFHSLFLGISQTKKENSHSILHVNTNLY